VNDSEIIKLIMINCINCLFILINSLIDIELTDILSYKILWFHTLGKNFAKKSSNYLVRLYIFYVKKGMC